MLATLKDRGFRRILTEGGPMLLGLVRPARHARRAVPDDRARIWSAAWPGASRPARVSLLTQMRCAHILTDEAGYLYTRYVKA